MSNTQASGNGRATAVLFAREGCDVAIAYLPSEQADADEVIKLIEAEGRKALGLPGDVKDESWCRELVSKTVEAFGGLDFLVNNTGINPAFGRMIDIDLVAASKIFQVNVVAAIGWAQKVYRASMAERGGAIVNIASVAGQLPAPGIGTYGASKAALIHVTEELAVELGPTIRVNAVAPAVVKTRFAQALYEGREEEIAAAYPLKRLGVPDDISSVVAFLLSDDSAWMTGQTLTIDGGVLLTGGV